MDEARARELLAAARERVENVMRELEPSPDDELSHVDQHPADEGSEMYTKEHDAGELERMRDELAAIERAEERLADGTYGVSVESGEPIPDARLEAQPAADRTVEEQSRYESGS